MELYGRVSSSNVQAVRWCLHELDLPYTRYDRGEHFGGLDTPEYRALNPNGKIPTLVVDGHPIFESSAIMRYLATVHGSDTFWPKTPLACAMVDKWTEWAKREIADLFTGPIFWRVVRMPKRNQNANAIHAAIAEFETGLTIAEGQLGKHDYLAGDDFTLADVVFGHVLFRYFDIDIQRGDFPNVAQYATRLAQRSAYQETVMLDYEDLRNTL